MCLHQTVIINKDQFSGQDIKCKAHVLFMLPFYRNMKGSKQVICMAFQLAKMDVVLTLSEQISCTDVHFFFPLFVGKNCHTGLSAFPVFGTGLFHSVFFDSVKHRSPSSAFYHITIFAFLFLEIFFYGIIITYTRREKN